VTTGGLAIPAFREMLIALLPRASLMKQHFTSRRRAGTIGRNQRGLDQAMIAPMDMKDELESR
jgi:hypothetical protein